MSNTGASRCTRVRPQAKKPIIIAMEPEDDEAVMSDTHISKRGRPLGAGRKWIGTSNDAQVHDPRENNYRRTLDNLNSQELWKVKSSIGDVARRNDWNHKVIDERENKVYFFGGQRSGTGETVPDFYCFEPSKKKWSDLTDRLRHSNPHNFLDGSKPFPKLFDPALAHVRLPPSERPYIFLFSGYDETHGSVEPTLIAIDLEWYAWSYVRIGGAPGPGRLDSAMVYSEAETALYIFGGRRDLEPASKGIASFSILKYDQVAHQWNWHTPERAEPCLSRMGYDIRALSLYNGTKIFLAPGKENAGNTPYNIHTRDILIFKTSTGKFNAQTQLNEAFPINKIRDYSIYESSAPLPTTIGRKRQHSPEIGEESLHPCILFVCWLDDPKTKTLLGTSGWIPEVWRYFMFPTDEMLCLGQALKIHNSLVTRGLYPLDATLDYARPAEGQPRLLLIGSGTVGMRATVSRANARAVTNSLLADQQLEDGDNGRKADDERVYFSRYAEINI